MSYAYDFDRFGHLVPFAPKADQESEKDSVKVLKPKKVSIEDIQQHKERDALLTDFGKKTLEDRYLIGNESFQDLFARVAATYADNVEHGQRIYDYISKLWFMPATPILSNGGLERGLPISCFLNEVDDSLRGIVDNYEENVWLATNGGGIGTYWGNVRSIGETIKKSGQTSGIVPFIRVSDSFTLAISQGSLRRGSAAVYLDIHHPEIEEFLEIRKPTGDFNRKCLNLHHGIAITDEFMEAVENDKMFGLKSPITGKVLREVSARILWQKILETRLQTGEPYLIFIDTVNRARPKHHKELGLKVKMSNLCSGIFLPTGEDHHKRDRTAVCCLSSMNLETWEEWSKDELIIEDVLRFLDNVLQDFIDHAPESMSKACYSAMRERSVGLGVMGFHSFLIKNNIPFESPLAKAWNQKMFKHIRQSADHVSYKLAIEKGACPDAQERGIKARFSHKLAIAPTASISIICGGTSACVEPIPANIYTHKTLSGSFSVRNKYLEALFIKKSQNTTAVWQSILEHQGSVQHLDFLTQEEKKVFKTAFEIDQRWIVEMAGDRSPYVCQGQSINLFIPPDINKWDLMMLHYFAWKKGVKSLYYLRSRSLQRAQFAGESSKKENVFEEKSENKTDYEECLACQ